MMSIRSGASGAADWLLWVAAFFCGVNAFVWLNFCCWLDVYAGCGEASTLPAPNQHWPKCSNSQPAVCGSTRQSLQPPTRVTSCHWFLIWKKCFLTLSRLSFCLFRHLTFSTTFRWRAQSFPSTSTRSDNCHQLQLSRCLILPAPHFNHSSPKPPLGMGDYTFNTFSSTV